MSQKTREVNRSRYPQQFWVTKYGKPCFKIPVQQLDCPDSCVSVFAGTLWRWYMYVIIALIVGAIALIIRGIAWRARRVATSTAPMVVSKPFAPRPYIEPLGEFVHVFVCDSRYSHVNTFWKLRHLRGRYFRNTFFFDCLFLDATAHRKMHSLHARWSQRIHWISTNVYCSVACRKQSEIQHLRAHRSRERNRRFEIKTCSKHTHY